MAQRIDITPAEQGSAIVTVSLTDEDDVALVFAQLTNPQWQLTKKDGTVVNGRTYASSSLTALTWAIYGDDLAMFGDDDDGKRIIGFKATYDSTIQNDLPLVAEGEFSIDPMVTITDQ